MSAIPEVVYYHMHSMLSNGTTNIDSITNFREYVKAAKKLGMKALGISEHGNLFEWIHKKEEIEKAGMKYIHCVETYVTEELYQYSDPDIPDEVYESMLGLSAEEQYEELKDYYEDSKKQVRDNYHCILIAKNYDGVKEINKLISAANSRTDGHMYYVPRITLDELSNTTDNIIVTTACLASILNNGTESAKEKYLTFLLDNKHRCYLEIQHHNVEEQIEYNRKLYNISKSTGIPLIVGTDTHALNNLHMFGRHVMQKSKGVNFANEDAWDLTFKTPEELVKVYKKQGSLPIEVVYSAMDETVRMADTIEEFKLDREPKYPKLYDDSETAFKQKINGGYKWRNITKKPDKSKYLERIKYEYETYKHNGAIDFMLLEEDYKRELRNQGVRYGYSRGSVSGSIIAYLLGITEIDSVKYNLNFERFMSKERISLADIDTDWYSEDRDKVREYLFSKKGLYCCDIITFNTIALRGAIRDVIRGLFRINVEKLEIPKELDAEIRKWKKENKNDELPKDLDEKLKEIYSKAALYKEVPYDYLRFAEKLCIEAEENYERTKKKYTKIFELVELVNGVVVSIGNHPSGCVVSPYPVDEWFATCTTKGNKYPISQIMMKEIDSLNFVKIDILGLDNVGLIYKTCDLAGIPYATPDNIPPDDEVVWNSIREDTTMIFQWESQSSTAYLKQLMSDETIKKIKGKNPNFSYMDLLSIGNGAIRPAGESYRDALAKGIYRDNGHDALNKLLEPTLGYLVYQCQIIEFLHSFCGYTMGEADLVRRAFSKKLGTEQYIPQIKEGFKKTMLEKYDVQPEESEKIIVNFIQVIEDASDYLFSKNHSDPYSWIGYICGYLRYYYPVEFITAALNIFASKEEKSLAIIDYAKRHGIKISSIQFRNSLSDYTFNKETNTIFKGLASIKYMNSAVANELYSLKDNKYDTFIDLLFDIDEKTSVNSRQLKILIDLDFFSEFGDANYLLQQFAAFDKFSGRSTLKKLDAERLGFDIENVRICAEKESPLQFSKVDFHRLLNLESGKIQYRSRTLKQKIDAQQEHLGYINIIGEQYSELAYVIEISTKYSPKIKMYSLKYGTIIDCKVSKSIYNKNKISKGDIIRVLSSSVKPKSRRLENGKFEPIPGTQEIWLSRYRKVENL